MPKLLYFFSILLIFLCLFFATNSQLMANEAIFFQNEVELDLYCLKNSYPDIKDVKINADGSIYLIIDNDLGKHEVLYSKTTTKATLPSDHLTDIRTTMLAPYPLEPLRPDLPKNFSPGRWRSLEFMTALYGNSEILVQKNLTYSVFNGQKIKLSKTIAKPLAKVDQEIAEAILVDAKLAIFLNSHKSGGYCWRYVRGEKYLSPHAYGIALDLSPEIAGYWRWSKLRPHPLQKTYPSAIVEAFEKHGFIWGGKWYEYDLMHFEYRPELICKAKYKHLILPENNLQQTNLQQANLQ